MAGGGRVAGPAWSDQRPRRAAAALRPATCCCLPPMMRGLLACLACLCLTLQHTAAAKQQIYLAATFPIGGSEGWQGGQVGSV